MIHLSQIHRWRAPTLLGQDAVVDDDLLRNPTVEARADGIAGPGCPEIHQQMGQLQLDVILDTKLREVRFGRAFQHSQRSPGGALHYCQLHCPSLHCLDRCYSYRKCYHRHTHTHTSFFTSKVPCTLMGLRCVNHWYSGNSLAAVSMMVRLSDIKYTFGIPIATVMLRAWCTCAQNDRSTLVLPRASPSASPCRT